MERQDDWQQAMLERQQMAEEALQRALNGKATPEDWETIYSECGIPQPKFPKIGEKE